LAGSWRRGLEGSPLRFTAPHGVRKDDALNMGDSGKVGELSKGNDHDSGSTSRRKSIRRTRNLPPI
jgi:hypothetical protein